MMQNEGSVTEAREQLAKNVPLGAGGIFSMYPIEALGVY